MFSKKRSRQCIQTVLWVNLRRNSTKLDVEQCRQSIEIVSPNPHALDFFAVVDSSRTRHIEYGLLI